MIQSLLRAADAYAGVPDKEELDTVQVGEDVWKVNEEKASSKRKIVIKESEENLFRKCIRQIREEPLPPFSERITFKLISDAVSYPDDVDDKFTSKFSSRCNKQRIEAFEVPNLAWDKVVYRMIHSAEPEAAVPSSSSAAQLSPRPKLGALDKASKPKPSSDPEPRWNSSLALPPQRFPFDISKEELLFCDRVSIATAKKYARGYEIQDDLDSPFPNPGLFECDSVEGVEGRGAVNETSKCSAPPPTAAAQPKEPDPVESAPPVRPETKAEREQRNRVEKLKRLQEVKLFGHDFSAALLQKQQSSRRPREDIPHIRNRLKAIFSSLNHTDIAKHHHNTKMDLSNQELRCFHRPRLVKANKSKNWVIQSLGYRDKKGKRLDKAPREESFLTSKPISYTDAEKQDLSLQYGDFVLMEYIEEHPPVLLNHGMASALFNYYRPEDPHGNDDEAKQASMQAMGFRSASGTQSQSFTQKLRVPKHYAMLVNQKGTIMSSELSSNAPKLPLGETKVLNPDEPSPFLWEIEPGEIVPSITNKLFRAPAFAHEARPSEFLMIRVRTDNQTNTMHFVLREIPQIILCGQLEPQQIVPKPSRTMTDLQERMIMLAAARFFQSAVAREGVDFRKVQDHLLKFYRCKSAFISVTMKKLLKDKIAEEDTINGDKKWFPKVWRVDEMDMDEDQTELDAKRKYSLEELESALTPEEICLQESCNACDRKYIDLGIYTDVSLPMVRTWLERMKSVKEFRIHRIARLQVLADCIVKTKGTSNAQWRACTQIIANWIQDLKTLEDKVKVAQFIYDRLVVAPWNTTEAFVKFHIEKDLSSRLELAGLGDPSGVGEGFAYVRSHSSTNAGKKREQLVDTDKDLRTLSRPEMTKMLLNFGMDEDKIRSLKRWDMVAIIRESSTKAEIEGIKSGITKFARTNTKPGAVDVTIGADNQKDLIQQIWRKQKRALMQAHSTGREDMLSPMSNDEEDAAWSKEEEGWEGFAEESIETIIKRRVQQLLDQEKALASNGDSEDFKAFKASFDGAAAPPAQEVRVRPKSKAALKRAANKLAKALAKSGQTEENTIVDNFGATTNAVEDGVEDVKARSVVAVASVNPSSASSSSLSSSTSSSSSSSQAVVAAGPAVIKQWPPGRRPVKAVKRTVRTVHEDGTESIEIQYLVSVSDVQRVEVSKSHNKYEDDYLEMAENAYLGEGDEEIDASSKPSMPLVLSLKNFKAGAEMEAITDSRGKVTNDSEYKPIKHTSRSGGININRRIPHIRFSALLEKLLMEEWLKPHSDYFRAPVPFELTRYYEIIKTPICLQDIREKVVSYMYSSVDSFLNDIELIYKNSEQFNGPRDAITLRAKQLYDSCKLSLTHDLKHLGPEKDEFSLLEKEIKKKNILLKRPQVSSEPYFQRYLESSGALTGSYMG